MACEPVDCGPRPRILPVAESGEHPERVPREAHLAAAAAEVARWAREPTEEEAYRFGDPRRLSCEAQVGEDEQPPVRRDVLRRSEEHTSELQSRLHLVCRLLLEKKKYREKNNR